LLENDSEFQFKPYEIGIYELELMDKVSKKELNNNIAIKRLYDFIVTPLTNEVYSDKTDFSGIKNLVECTGGVMLSGSDNLNKINIDSDETFSFNGYTIRFLWNNSLLLFVLILILLFELYLRRKWGLR